MKTIIYSLRIVMFFLAVVSFYSCEEKYADNGNGTVEFSVSLPDDLSQAKSASSTDSAMVSFQIMVSLKIFPEMLS